MGPNDKLTDIVPLTNITYGELARRRAEYIKQRLIANGVKSSQIKTTVPQRKAHTAQKITATFRQ